MKVTRLSQWIWPLKIPFSEIAAPEDTSIVIEAHSAAMARITIDMPAEAYDGVVLGGLVFTQRPEDNAPRRRGDPAKHI